MSIQETIKNSSLWPINFNSDSEIELLKNNVLELCEEACERMKITYIHFPQYTLHDETHISNMITLVSMILQDKISSLSELEKLILILGICFHDIGMAPNEEELESLLSSSEYEVFSENWKINHSNFVNLLSNQKSSIYSEIEKAEINEKISLLEKACLTEYLRREHPENAKKFIENLYNNDKRLLFHGINITPFIFKLAIAHGKDISFINDSNGFRCDEQIHTYKVNMSFLAVLIRLSDVLDFDRSRTPDLLYKSIKFEDPISIKEWEKHRTIRGWTISNKEISFTAECTHPVYENVVRSFINQIEIELQNCITLTKKYPKAFSRYSLDLPFTIDRSRIGPKDNLYITHNVEFSLSRNEIINLLMTDKLYSTPSLCIRELLQNAADAIRTRRSLNAQDGFDYNNGKIEFTHYLNSNNEEILECRDNGVGMDLNIINNYFTRVGRSYYKSPEFNQLRKRWKEKNVDFDPCSQFGIGFMSCFMLGDQIEIKTRKDYGIGKDSGDPLIIEINGTEGIFFVKKGDSEQEIGTTVRIKIRNRNNYYDIFNDKVKLITTLRGYALGGEFPIYGKCTIGGIAEETYIEPGISRNPSFLEIVGIKKLKCFSIDLKTISPYLSGNINESFLVDDNGKLTLENNEAAWVIDSTHNSMDVALKYDNVLYSNYEKLHSICFDGILITGRGGRIGDKKKVFDFIGWRNPGTYNNASFCVDVRGDLKAEITPARIPVENSSMHTTPRWQKIHDCLNKGEAKIWGNIISENISTPNIFWQLVNIYEPNLLFLNSKDVLNLVFPVIKDGKISYKSTSAFLNFQIENNKIILSEEEILKFPDYCEKWKKSHSGWNCNYLTQRILILCSIAKIINGLTVFSIDTKSNNFCIGDKILRNTFNIVLGINFDESCKQYLSIYSENPIINSQHPLFILANEAKYKTEKNEIEKFAWRLCLNIPGALKTDENTLNIPNKSFLKYLGNLYFSIEWEKYSSNLKAPYLVKLSNSTDFSITEEILESWKNIKDESLDFFDETEKHFFLKRPIKS